MRSLSDLERDFYKIIDSDNILLFEELKGEKIFITFNEIKKPIIRLYDTKSEPININDQSYNSYLPLYHKLSMLSSDILNLIKSLQFEFTYNNDIIDVFNFDNFYLSYIIKKDKRYLSYNEMIEYSRLIGVNHTPFLFQGNIKDDNKFYIKYFLEIEEKDLYFVFSETKLSVFINNLLSIDTSKGVKSDINNYYFLLDDGSIHSYNIIDEYHKIKIGNNITNIIKTYNNIILDFASFIEKINLKTLKLKSETKKELYNELLGKLFILYYSDNKESIENVNIIVPDFFNNRFKSIRNDITDSRVINIISSDIKYEYIFNCVYDYFKIKHYGSDILINDELNNIMNVKIDQIYNYIIYNLNKKTFIDISKSPLIDFGKFFDIKYNTDASGALYPSLYDEITNTNKDKKNKKFVTLDSYKTK